VKEKGNWENSVFICTYGWINEEKTYTTREPSGDYGALNPKEGKRII
jgi:hypothetical protein